MEGLSWAGTYVEKFARFERAAAKGHEEAIWIVSVVKDVAMELSAWKEAFAKAEEPIGWYLAGWVSGGRERFDFWKKSAEGGCSWGQVWYGTYFKRGYGEFVEEDQKVYVEWLEKGVNQNNPEAMYFLGDWFRHEGGDDKEKAVSYFRGASELGWQNPMGQLSEMLRDGEGCEKDLRQAVILSAKGDSWVFWDMLEEGALESGATEDLDCDFNEFCHAFGWGLYWYLYDSEEWNEKSDEIEDVGERCLDYYCSCLELQQKSIFTFLLFWNRTTGRVREPGRIIAQMVWEGREENLVIEFGDEEELLEEPAPRRSARLKRIKK
jgi:hypothetical protein